MNYKILIVGLVLLSGCVEEKPAKNPKYCEKDSDCTIEYGVNFQGNCDAGCFNERYIEERCRDMLWEPFSPEFECACIANQCAMVRL